MRTENDEHARAAQRVTRIRFAGCEPDDYSPEETAYWTERRANEFLAGYDEDALDLRENRSRVKVAGAIVAIAGLAMLLGFLAIAAAM